MIKILDCNNKNYVSKLSKLLIKRKSDDKISKNIVVKIIRDVKKNGDKAVVKYEKKYSKNSEIIVNKKKVSKSISFFSVRRCDFQVVGKPQKALGKQRFGRGEIPCQNTL